MATGRPSDPALRSVPDIRHDQPARKPEGCRTSPRRGTPHPAAPVRAIVELPAPIRPAGHAGRAPHKLRWAGGVHLLGGAIMVVPGRTIDSAQEARALAASILAAAARMEVPHQ